jgi:hypothetical protein
MSDSLERARENRASLRSAMRELESALAAPAPGREGPWRREIGAKLDVLGGALESHIAATEHEDGLLAQIMSSAPRLARRIDRATADHVRLRADLQQASATVAADAAVTAVRDHVGALLIDLVRHRQLGSDLVYDAYNIDIEGAD